MSYLDGFISRLCKQGTRILGTPATRSGQRLSPWHKALACQLSAAKSRAVSFLWEHLLDDNHITVPTLPESTSRKPVVLFDAQNFLLSDRFSLKRFDFVLYRRAFCEEFLFNMIKNFELINISELPGPYGSGAINKIDPFGCISYRLALNRKRDFTLKNLNRPAERLLVISTDGDEFHRSMRDNTILVPKWNGKRDSTLFDLLHFCNTLYYLSVDDYRPTIKSYRGREFFATARAAQKSLFQQRNLLSFTSFEKKLEETNNARIDAYKTARREMEGQKTVQLSDVLGNVFAFARHILFL